jgi:hypothetical protein
MKKIILLLAVLIPGAAYSQEYLKLTNAVDTPTAFTIPRGSYQISFVAYDAGGVQFKTFIGIHDAVYIGASEDIEHALGKEKPDANEPAVVAKAKLTDGWETFPLSIAVGYDTFYLGSFGKIENAKNSAARLESGPYLVFTKPIYLFNDEQYFSAGIRFPVRPTLRTKDTSYFLSLCVPMGRSFTFKAETERIYYNFSRSEYWLLNFGLRFNILSRVGLECDLLKQRHENLNRIIKVEYNNEF